VNPRKFGLDMDVRWNSTYLMLKHFIPYKSTFSTFIAANYGLINGEPLLSEDHWTIAEKIMEFFGIFYDSTVALSGVYYPTSPLMLHHILEIAGHLHSREIDPLLLDILIPMKLKFLKYWQNIPLLYSFAFVLDPRAKIRGFHNVLQILSQIIGVDYSNYFSEVRTELYKLYNKYENKYGAVRLQRPSNILGSTGKKKQYGVRSMKLLVHLLILLLLHLLLLLLLHLYLLFLSWLPTWTATLSLALMMILTS